MWGESLFGADVWNGSGGAAAVLVPTQSVCIDATAIWQRTIDATAVWRKSVDADAVWQIEITTEIPEC